MSLNHAGNAYAQKLADSARTPAEHQVPNKTYYNRHNYAKFHFDMGGSAVKTISFANYRYITGDKREQDQLDLVADMPGTMIYTIPNSDVDAALNQELNQALVGDVMKTAAAAAAASGQQFDPNAPIVPVRVNHVQPQQGVAVRGTQNSFSGTQAVESIEGKQVPVTAAPDAAQIALERLNAMTAQAKASQQNPSTTQS